MKRFLGLLLIITIAITPIGCISSGGGGDSSGSGGGSAGLDKSEVTLVFNLGEMLAMKNTDQDIMLAKIIDFITMTKTCYAANLYDYIKFLYIRVTGGGMTDIIQEVEIANPSSTFSRTLTVPNGNRIFEIKLKDRDGNVLYSGDLTIDVGNGGAPQDITIDVNIEEGITAGDYIIIGRGHLEDSKLELAFIAFDTAVSIELNHPVANFFRGFTRLLLLVQKDDSTVDSSTTIDFPDSDITSMLNLYTGIDVYSSTIAPDIYDDDDNDTDGAGPDTDEDGQDGGYDDKLGNFFDKDWTEPENLTTDEGIDLIEDVILPQIDNLINDLAKAVSDPAFYTTLTTKMHFGISSEIKVDRGDIYILEAIAYGLEAYYNHILAYNMQTDIDYWRDEFNKDSEYPLDPENKEPPYYQGLQYVIDNDPGNEDGLNPPDPVFRLVDDYATYLGNAKSAYSSGLDKLKSGLQFMNGNKRSNADKEEENHIFNVVDTDDPVLDVGPEEDPPDINQIDISRVTTNIDEIKAALDGAQDITLYDDYDDSKDENYDTTNLDLSEIFSSPDINSLPEFYYHAESDEDMPIFDTNYPASSSDFFQEFKNVVRSVDETPINDLKDALKEELLPLPYKFGVPEVGSEGITVDGLVDDYLNDIGEEISPVMFDEDEGEKPQGLDLLEVRMAQDDEYLYIALSTRGITPAGSFGTDDNFTYSIRFNARNSDCSYDSVPVGIELRWDQEEWVLYLLSYGNYIGTIDDLEYEIDCVIGEDAVEFGIPLEVLTSLINEYQRVGSKEEGWEWNEKEFFFAASVWSNVSFEGYDEQWYSDWVGECLAVLNSGE